MAIHANKSGALKEITDPVKQIWIKNCTVTTCDNTITLPFLPEYTILLSTKTYGSTANDSYPAAMLGLSSTVNSIGLSMAFVSSSSMALSWSNKSAFQMKISHSSGYGDATRTMTFILIAIS